MFDVLSYNKLIAEGNYEPIFKSPELSYYFLKDKSLVKERKRAFKTLLKSSRFSLIYLKTTLDIPLEERKQIILSISTNARNSLYALKDFSFDIHDRELLLNSVLNDGYVCVLALRDIELSPEEKIKVYNKIKMSSDDSYSAITLLNLPPEVFDDFFNVAITNTIRVYSIVNHIGRDLIKRLTSQQTTIIVDKILELNDFKISKSMLNNKAFKLSKEDNDKLHALIIMHELSKE